ncbi:MAG: hypothetical protein HW380_750 [Magnetococcales bacterium]|nr:hypothetical protein [Magnetococcales bacterium]
MYRKNKVWQKLLWGSGGDHPPQRGLGQRPKVLVLNLNKKLHVYGGLGAKPTGHHVQKLKRQKFKKQKTGISRIHPPPALRIPSLAKLKHPSLATII